MNKASTPLLDSLGSWPRCAKCGGHVPQISPERADLLRQLAAFKAAGNRMGALKLLRENGAWFNAALPVVETAANGAGKAVPLLQERLALIVSVLSVPLWLILGIA